MPVTLGHALGLTALGIVAAGAAFAVARPRSVTIVDGDKQALLFTTPALDSAVAATRAEADSLRGVLRGLSDSLRLLVEPVVVQRLVVVAFGPAHSDASRAFASGLPAARGVAQREGFQFFSRVGGRDLLYDPQTRLHFELPVADRSIGYVIVGPGHLPRVMRGPPTTDDLRAALRAYRQEYTAGTLRRA